MNEEPKRSDAFAPTRWTLVLRARGDSVALGELCEAYYAPVLAFLRREGREEDAARELAHDFFARLLSDGSLGRVDPKRGRFRSFLLGALKHFLADQHDRGSAAKRGAGIEHVPLSAATETSPGFDVADPAAAVPDAEFDRQWALTLLDRALGKLADEMSGAGKGAQFEELKPWLTGEAGHCSQQEAATRLGMTEGAVKVAVHRLRQRFRSLVTKEIVETVGHADQVQEELRMLLEAVSPRAGPRE